MKTMQLIFMGLLGGSVLAKDQQAYWNCKAVVDKIGRYSNYTHIECLSNMLMTFEYFDNTAFIPDDGQISADDYSLPPCLVDNKIVSLREKVGVDYLRVPFPGKKPAPEIICNGKFRISFFPMISSGDMQNNDTAQMFQTIARCLAYDLETPKCELEFESNQDKEITKTIITIVSIFGVGTISAIALAIFCKKRHDAQQYPTLLEDARVDKPVGYTPL